MTDELPRCERPECIEMLANREERKRQNWHTPEVHAFVGPTKHWPNVVARCEGCGAYHDGDRWHHVCSKCGSTVEPGSLTGLFVPHKCQECNQKIIDDEREKGHVCRRCGNVSSWCYC